MTEETNKKIRLPENFWTYLIAWILGSGFMVLLYIVVAHGDKAARGF